MSNDEPPIQVVDRNDQPIGVAAKQEAWITGAIHRIVWVVVESSEGRILLQKRSKNMEHYAGAWDISGGGHVDAGEDWESAAKRELKEELNLSSSELKRLGKFYSEINFNGKKLNRFYTTYKVVTRQKIFDYDKQEVDELRWASREEINSLIQEKSDKVTNGLIEVIERYYS